MPTTLPTRRTFASLVAVAAFAGPIACVEGDAVVGSDAETIFDDIDTFDPDVPFCDFSTCFDQDPCTDDFCDSDGTCLHVARNPFGACQVDAHCDDGNPCTTDSCVTDECGLDRCSFVQTDPMCRPCGFGCDDGNPCTEDLCGESGLCESVASDPACEPRCNQLMAQTVDAAQWAFNPGGAILYQGLVGSLSGTNCADGECACEAQMTLSEYGFAAPLRDAESGEDYSCAVTSCAAPSLRCEPMFENTRYIVWGTVRYQQPFGARDAAPQADAGPSDASADTAAPPDTFAPDATGSDAGASIDTSPPPGRVEAIEVAGYCLSTYPNDLQAVYTATFESGGRKAELEVQLFVDQYGAQRVEPGACVGCTELDFELPRGSFWTETGAVWMDVMVGGQTVNVHLFPNRNRFAADVKSNSITYLGTLTLERKRP